MSKSKLKLKLIPVKIIDPPDAENYKAGIVFPSGLGNMISPMNSVFKWGFN